MLSLEEGIQAVKLAREAVERYVKNNQEPLQGFEREFEERQGAFVTLNTYPERELRGCIGVPLPVMPLREAIIESAESATRDPRFPPLKEAELDRILVEVTILTKPELIEVKQPQDYPLNIEIGRDGLIVEQGFYKGLLLPQVPVEQGWNKEEFLSHTCMKAGLLPDAWFDKNTKISRFGGQIFTEIKPRGEIKEKTLDGTNN
ncbi:MAG: TIGR00296 family protein [Candidatus Asgardarchaeum californiense]|nr:MAG: TIGR00296 family protein [Candidatus Asgardarchaeum californiense]